MKKLFCVFLTAAALTACGKGDLTPEGKAITYKNELSEREAQALTDAQVITLHKLDPNAIWNANRTGLASYKTISRTTLRNANAHEAASALLDAIARGDKKPTNCVFVPDYALTVKASGHIYDYLISYGCKQAIVFNNNVDDAWLNIEGKPAVFEALAQTAPEPVKKVKTKKAKRKKAK